MIPVRLAETDDAPSALGRPVDGLCATCTLCGTTAAEPFAADCTRARTGRDAIRALARTCPSEAVHTYYPNALPEGVRLEYLHRGRRLPCHLIGREIVGGGGAISKAARVFAVCETEAVAKGRGVKRLVAMLGPKRRKATPGRAAEPGRKGKPAKPAYTIPGWAVAVEVEQVAAGSA